MTDLINDLMRCDGRRESCEKCTYREHPKCRDAIAREAAAVLAHRETQLEIAKSMLGKVILERDEALKMIPAALKAVEARELLLKAMMTDLDACKHCKTCKYDGYDWQDDIDDKCKECVKPGAPSMWEPKDKYTTIKPVEEPEEHHEVEDVTEITDDA